MKTSELIGPALDWAVAKCEGVAIHKTRVPYQGKACLVQTNFNNKRWHPSTNWSQGGPIIEREKIAIDWDHDCWNAAKDGCGWYIGGPTPLIAAIRCLVASKLGDEVDIPEELK